MLWFFLWSCMDVTVGLWRRLSAEELIILNSGDGEDSWESLGQQGDPTSPSWRRSVLSIHWKDWCWSWNSTILATWCKELTHWKRPWCWERLKAGEVGDDRGWDGWMASLTQWTWVWVNSKSWWWTGRPDVLQSMGSQRVGHDLSDWTEQVKKHFEAAGMIKDCRLRCQAHLDTKPLGSKYCFCDHDKLWRSSISHFVKRYEILIVAMLPIKNTLVKICKMPSIRLDTQVFKNIVSSVTHSPLFASFSAKHILFCLIVRVHFIIHVL